MGLTVIVAGYTATQFMKRVSFRNSIEATPVLEAELADLSFSYFDIGAIVEVWEGSTKLIEGEIKEITINISEGITSKVARIHVRDIKEKIFSYDLTAYSGLDNIEAIEYMCAQAGVTLVKVSSFASPRNFAMKKADNSIPFFATIQEICASEGWGCFCNHDTIWIKDFADTVGTKNVLGSTIINARHNINDLNCYGNVAVKGKVLTERLISDDNPFSEIIFSDLQTIDTMSITADNETDLLSIISGSVDFGYSQDDNERGNFTFFRINATSILNTFNPDTVSIVDTSENFFLQGYESIPYKGSDKIGTQCEILKIFGYVPDSNSQVKIILDIQAKKITSYTSGKTTDRFFLAAKDTNATANAKSNYLYYENRNISKFEQLEEIAGDLLKETSNRILTIEFKLYTSTTYKPLDRLYIYNANTDYNGYWTVIDVRTNTTDKFQVSEFKCCRHNVAIIPSLNIYILDTILNKIKEGAKNTFKVMFADNNQFYDFKYGKLKKLINPYNLKPRKGDIVFVDKAETGEYILKAKSEKEYNVNEDALPVKDFNSAASEVYRGGNTSAYDADWNAGISTTTTKKYNETISGTPEFSISSVTSTHLGGETAEIEIEFSNDIDESTFDKTSLKIFSA